jgi:hypothetical protein
MSEDLKEDEMSERTVDVEALRKRLPPDVEQRVDRAVQTFRENHRSPANLALHAIGYYAILKGVVRFLRKKRFRAFTLIGMGIALILAGHEIEGTEPFAIFKDSRSPAS